MLAKAGQSIIKSTFEKQF